MENKLILDTRLDSTGNPAIIIKATQDVTGGDADIFWLLLEKLSNPTVVGRVEIHPVEELAVDRWSLPEGLQSPEDANLDLTKIPKMYRRTVINLFVYPETIGSEPPVPDVA